MFTRFKAVATAAVAASLVAAPTIAAAAPANPSASLSLAHASAARTGAPVTHAGHIGAAVPTGTLISIGILAALVAIVLVATDGGDDTPDSP